MDIFTLSTSGSIGKIVNGLDEVVWTERYLKAGDLKATTTNLELAKELPMGTYVSHNETLEIIKVLDHQIIKERGQPAKLIITGDTLEKPLLESRISIPSLTGTNNPRDGEMGQYRYAENSSWVHAQYLIEGHLTGNLDILHIGELVTGIECVQEITEVESPLLPRSIERGQVYDQVLKLLAIGNCGLKIRRPIGNKKDIEIVIYKGKNRSSEVNISSVMDEVDQASYLFSIRKKKTAAFVSGTLEYVMVFPPGETGGTGLNADWLHVDATDIEMPTLNEFGDPDIYGYYNLLRARGVEALAQYKSVEMADITPYYEFSSGYNVLYGMGDIIGVSGDYGGRSNIRVEEFTWTKDKNGVSHFPTFGPVSDAEISGGSS